MTDSCFLCSVGPQALWLETALSRAISDAFPLSPGHTLIVPKRHVASYFELTPDEQHDLMNLVGRCKAHLDSEFSPDGYNLGINDGTAAGQTVMHVHLHLIPRYAGDREDPRGGIRWVLPDKAAYWEGNDE